MSGADRRQKDEKREMGRPTSESAALLGARAAAPATGHWQAAPDSEQRRLALLPLTPPLGWDDLMHDPVYQHALECLP